MIYLDGNWSARLADDEWERVKEWGSSWIDRPAGSVPAWSIVMDDESLSSGVVTAGSPSREYHATFARPFPIDLLAKYPVPVGAAAGVRGEGAPTRKGGDGTAAPSSPSPPPTT